MITLVQEPFSSKPEPARTPKRRTMTVALGFLCHDGIVLCSDRQITKGEMKYEEQKICGISGNGYKIAFTYAGDPDQMKRVHQDFNRKLNFRAPEPILVQSILEDLLLETHVRLGEEMNLECLCAVSSSDGTETLFRTNNKKVSPGYQECLGVGESALIHYILGLLPEPVSQTHEASLLGIYLIVQVKRNTDGCGGRTDLAILRKGEWNSPPRVIDEIELDLFAINAEFGQILTRKFGIGGTP